MIRHFLTVRISLLDGILLKGIFIIFYTCISVAGSQNDDTLPTELLLSFSIM